MTELKVSKQQFAEFILSQYGEGLHEDIKASVLESWEKHYEVITKRFVLVDKAELRESALEIDKPSNSYGEVCRQNRMYQRLLGELLEVSK